MNFLTYKDSNEKCLTHSKSNNEETMTAFDKEELIEEFS